MAAVKYKDFELSPRPHQFIDTKDWLVGVTITRLNGSHGEKRQKRFFSHKVFNEKQNAERNAVQFGKDIIDGKHANLLIGNL
jgi:hypothetical protein